MTRRIVPLSLLALVVASAGCYRPTLNSTGPSMTLEGVHVEVTGAMCIDRINHAGTRHVRDEDVLIEVVNPTPSSLEVRPEALTLVLDSGAAIPSFLPQERFVLAAHERWQFPAQFVDERLQCGDAVRLLYADALMLDHRPLVGTPIGFVSGHRRGAPADEAARP